MTYEIGRADSDSVNLGSNPSPPATIPIHSYCFPALLVAVRDQRLGQNTRAPRVLREIGIEPSSVAIIRAHRQMYTRSGFGTAI